MQREQRSTLFLSITNPDEIHLEKEWIEECQQLYFEIGLKLEEGTVTPMNVSENNGDRGSPIDLFQNLLLTGINLGIFKAVYDLLKLWLENKPTCEVTITYPDGFTMKISKISLDKALELHKQHNQETVTNNYAPKLKARKHKT